MYNLDRLQHGVEPVGDRLKPCRRRDRFCSGAGGLEHLGRLCAGLLERRKTGPLRLGWMNPRFDLGGRPVHHAGRRGSAALNERVLCVLRGFAPALILPERVQPGSLFIVQEVVKFLQRRLNRPDRGYHCLDPLLHGCEPTGRRQRYLCRTRGFDVLRRLHGGIGEIIQRRTLGVIRLNNPLDLIYRQTGDVAVVITAHLRQLVWYRSPGAGDLSNIDPRTAGAWCQIAYEVIIAVGGEKAGKDVIVAVAPEQGIVAIAPYRVVINVVIGERPKYRADPAVSAAGMSPPPVSPAAAALPSRRGRTRNDLSASIWIVQRSSVAQCAGDGA